MKKLFNAFMAVAVAGSVYGADAIKDGRFGTDITSPIDSRGNLEVILQNQISKPVVFYFTQVVGMPTTVAVTAAVDDVMVTITDTSNCTTNGYIGFFNADDPLDNRAFFASTLAITGNVVHLDTPLDFEFQVGDTAACLDRELDIDGSATNQIFSIQVGSAANQSIDITRIMVTMLTGSAVSLATFGDLAALTKGCVLRRTNGTTVNIFNIKSNGDLANLCYDYLPLQATNPSQGQDGALFRYTFAGTDKHGVAIRLDPGDRLDFIIQDNISSLTQFRIIGEGHYVED